MLVIIELYAWIDIFLYVFINYKNVTVATKMFLDGTILKYQSTEK